MRNSNFSHFLLNDPYNVLRGLSTIGFVLGLVLVFRPYRILEQPSASFFNGTALHDNVALASSSIIENTTWANQTDVVSSNFTVTNLHLQEESSVRQRMITFQYSYYYIECWFIQIPTSSVSLKLSHWLACLQLLRKLACQMAFIFIVSKDIFC